MRVISQIGRDNYPYESTVFTIHEYDNSVGIVASCYGTKSLVALYPDIEIAEYELEHMAKVATKPWVRIFRMPLWLVAADDK